MDFMTTSRDKALACIKVAFLKEKRSDMKIIYRGMIGEYVTFLSIFPMDGEL